MTLQLPGRTARGVTTRLVGSYPTFSPLPRICGAVIFFCVYPAVADTLHINKRDALRCPDFPHTPRGSKRQTVQLLSYCKNTEFLGDNIEDLYFFILSDDVLDEKNMHYTCMNVAMYSAYVMDF